MNETNRHLLRAHRNEPFGFCREVGLTPEDFEWKDVVSNFDPFTHVSALAHRPSGYVFVFDYDAAGGRHYASEQSPADDHAGTVRSWYDSRDEQIRGAKHWLTRAYSEVALPDLWTASLGEETILRAPSAEDLSNEAFTPQEQEKIAAWSRELREYIIATYDVSIEQMQLLQRRLDYLAQASARVGAKDWACMCGGALIGWLLSATLPVDAVRDVLRFAGMTLRNFLDWPFLLP